MIDSPEPQEVSMRSTFGFLAVGLIPLVMLVAFWLRSGTGLHLALIGFMFALVGSFLVSLNYYLFYRQHLPRSALVPPSVWKGLLVAAVLIPIGAYNMLATSAGIGLTLSPGPRIESSQWASAAAKVVGLAYTPRSMKPLKWPPHAKLNLQQQPWLVKPPFINGALWGALGYCLPFGFAGMVFGLLRKEILDPRDEHLGSGAVAGLGRGAVGLYYGSAVGFAMGAVLIWVLRTMFPTLAQTTPQPFLHWIYVLGAASNPNVAFSYAFSTACLLAGATALFSGRRDFTVQISDPKAPELTRPVEVNIPEIPDAPQQGFDMGRVQQESQQLMAAFQTELGRMFQGPEWNYERYDLPAVGKGGKSAEPAATNVISARDTFDDDDAGAMGSLSNVYVQIVVDLGKLELPAANWLFLREGAILELPKSADNLINISINGKPAGKGRALTINGNKAVKMVNLRTEVEKLVKTASGG
jgi:flagellar motor switch/type III secretory pathway protein FliN